MPTSTTTNLPLRSSKRLLKSPYVIARVAGTVLLIPVRWSLAII